MIKFHNRLGFLFYSDLGITNPFGNLSTCS